VFSHKLARAIRSRIVDAERFAVERSNRLERERARRNAEHWVPTTFYIGDSDDEDMPVEQAPDGFGSWWIAATQVTAEDVSRMPLHTVEWTTVHFARRRGDLSA